MTDIGFVLNVGEKNGGLSEMEELSEREKHFLAFALQSMMMRIGPRSFTEGLSIARKTGSEGELKTLLGDWIRYAEGKQK